jgi:hypothetical protein
VTRVAFSNSKTLWTRGGRFSAFVLAATSIGCLFAEFFSGGSMRAWVCFLFAPACLVLALLSYHDWRRNDRAFARMIIVGAAAGLLAAVAYDVFRLPFVYSERWKLSGFVPALDLFKVFPRFGAAILGQSIQQPVYTPMMQLLGWTYHFSNGATFGVMYVALLGDPSRRHWGWGILFAAGIEIAMLLSPYPGLFGISLTLIFVCVTLAAHTIFGATMGVLCRRWAPAQLGIRS